MKNRRTADLHLGQLKNKSRRKADQNGAERIADQLEHLVAGEEKKENPYAGAVWTFAEDFN